MITFKEAVGLVCETGKIGTLSKRIDGTYQMSCQHALGKCAIIRIKARSAAPDSWLTDVTVYEFGDYSTPLVERTWRFALTECGVRQAVDKYNELCDKIASAELK